MKKLAIIHAGQGSQYVGMGLDFLETGVLSEDQLTYAVNELGFSIKEALNDKEIIHQTRYTQPLVLLTTLAIYEYLKPLKMKMYGTLGFSLGEYSALYLAGVLDYHSVINIVNKRAQFMDECAKSQKGSMAAIMGLSSDVIKKICDLCDNEVYVANYNSPDQTVISGTEEGVSEFSQKALEHQAKRVIKLSVSGAFHSPMMRLAAQKLDNILTDVKLNEPLIPLYLNTTAQPLNLDSLREEMIKQITSPVRFVESILAMKQDGFTHFLEIGPGKTLSGLVKKIDLNLDVMSFDKIEQFDTVKGWLETHGFIE